MKLIIKYIHVYKHLGAKCESTFLRFHSRILDTFYGKCEYHQECVSLLSRIRADWWCWKLLRKCNFEPLGVTATTSTTTSWLLQRGVTIWLHPAFLSVSLSLSNSLPPQRQIFIPWSAVVALVDRMFKNRIRMIKNQGTDELNTIFDCLKNS